MGLFFRKKKPFVSEPPKPDPHYYALCNSYPVLRINADTIMPLAKKTNGFPFDYDELKDTYAIGEKVYEYELFAHTDRLSLSLIDGIFHILLDGADVGRISKTKTNEIQEIISKYGISRLNLSVGFGRCQVVERNDNPNTELYGENDNKWITWDDAPKPKAKIEISYQKPWS